MGSHSRHLFSIAAASYAGIPLTHRDYSSSVAFITGRDGCKRRRGVEWSLAANAADTLVIFMCGRRIAEIACDLIRYGWNALTPVAIVRWGTYGHQEVYSGTLEEIAEANGGVADPIRFEPPAIAIVGDVVSLKDRLNWFDHRALDIAESRKRHVGVRSAARIKRELSKARHGARISNRGIDSNT